MNEGSLQIEPATTALPRQLLKSCKSAFEANELIYNVAEGILKLRSRTGGQS